MSTLDLETLAKRQEKLEDDLARHFEHLTEQSMNAFKEVNDHLGRMEEVQLYHKELLLAHRQMLHEQSKRLDGIDNRLDSIDSKLDRLLQLFQQSQ